ncbi:MAG: phosphoribosylanthranilate isomerase [Candidatus Onthomonas sp.]
MTKIKLCGLSRPYDIEAANELKPDYIGFVFAPKSRRYVSARQAAELRRSLDPGIQAVGVFVNETPETVAALLNRGIIDLAQLHGTENEAYLDTLRELTHRPVIQAFRIRSEKDCAAARRSTADYVLLDSGAGTGTVFDWTLIRKFERPYFLAGGLDPENVAGSVRLLHPYAVDVSSGIETDGKKDRRKMAEFVSAVRGEDRA